MKKLKIGLFVTVLSFIVGIIPVLAADLNFTDDTTVTVNSRAYTISAGSAATSFVIDATTFTVAVPSGSTFNFVSANRDELTNDLGLAQVCTASTNTVAISGPNTVIFTPTSTACTISTGGGGVGTIGGGGGGGGGNPSPAPVVTVTTTNTTPTPTTISGCDNRTTGFSTVTGQSCSGNTTTVTVTTPVVIAGCGNRTSGFSTASGVSCASNKGTVTTTTSYNFGTVTLKNGSKGNAVMELQRFLNAKLHLGLVIDGKLGPKTIIVIKKWQKDHGLVVDGLIGPKTKEMMNAEAETGN